MIWSNPLRIWWSFQSAFNIFLRQAPKSLLKLSGKYKSPFDFGVAWLLQLCEVSDYILNTDRPIYHWYTALSLTLGHSSSVVFVIVDSSGNRITFGR